MVWNWRKIGDEVFFLEFYEEMGAGGDASGMLHLCFFE